MNYHLDRVGVPNAMLGAMTNPYVLKLGDLYVFKLDIKFKLLFKCIFLSIMKVMYTGGMHFEINENIIYLVVSIPFVALPRTFNRRFP